MKTKKLSDQEAAKIEFLHEPMGDYYNHRLIGIPSRFRVNKIFQELGNIKNKKLLDVGCEAGYITLQLAKKGALVTAIDLITEPIRKFEQELKAQPAEIRRRIKLRVADATKMPFGTNIFDIVLATEVIEHITELERFVAGASKVLKPGGKLLVTFPNENLRQKLYPLVSLFGIKAEVENQVTLKNYRANNILKIFTKKFRLVKFYRLPWFLPITNLMLFKKPGRA